MAAKSVEIREKRATLVNEARAILKRSDDEKRDLSTDESAHYDRIMADVDKKKVDIDRLERIEKAEDDLDTPQERSSRPLNGENRATPYKNKAELRNERMKIKAAMRHWVRSGQMKPELRSNQNRIGEFRDMLLGAVGADTTGGFLIAPVQVSKALIKQIDNLTFIRELAHVERVTEAKSLGVRQLTTRMSNASWTTEVQSVTPDTTQVLNRRDLTPTLLSKLSLVSIRLLLSSADAQSLINTELAYQFAITEENAYQNGSGSGQPLGVFTASASGIDTSRDQTSSVVNSFNADDLITAKFSLKQPYLRGPKATWIFNRTVVSTIRKFKDAYGQYLWAPGLTAGAPDRIIDVPYCMSEYTPNTMATGNYYGILGNFEYYWIAEVTDMILQRLVERYADTNEVGFIGRRFLDGSPVLAEAFSRLKCG